MSNSESSIVRRVLGYFLARPTAVETLEDVARWRLRALEISSKVKETNDALEWLVSRGLLERVTTRNAQALFRLNAERREEAERFLVQDPEDDADSEP